MVIVRCQRCNRRLTDPISRDRGYGPVCFEKINHGYFENDRIQHLEKELAILKKQLFALTATPSIPMPPSNGSGSHTPETKIPLMMGGWDVSELQENPLFQKMQVVCEVA